MKIKPNNKKITTSSAELEILQQDLKCAKFVFQNVQTWNALVRVGRYKQKIL